MDELDEDELLQFEHSHIRSLNTLEGWNRSVQETSRDKAYRITQEQNVKETINVWFSQPGSQKTWDKCQAAFPLVSDIFNDVFHKRKLRDQVL